ncbi:hypothetical protein P6144_13445 [Sphingomonas sp. HITSZ_GF]|uniref:hypothetical protein n=1 Tax=Sphingomonas sp. HITSZ_GF TaxID=3037247 RepID=UPI00240E5201|nr:hypothetical protein [Sphingomonas sp. HITSZ_GF]MDG2534661.1 hypothetical protein [Sphingomonas sp. HITSZ_GF]
MAGLATLAASMGFPPVDACGPTHGAGPIIAFELVRNPSQLAELFGPPSCSGAFQAAQTRASWWDALAFIPAYAAFLALGACAMRNDARRLSLVAVATFLVAALLDQIEGLILFQLAAHWQSPPGLFGALFFTVRPKFALLGIGSLLLAALAWRGTLLGKIAAVPLAAGGLASLWFLFTDPHDPAMMLGHRYAWMALLALAAIGSINPRWTNRT